MRNEKCASQSVLVVCYGGNLSFTAAQYLVDNGWTSVYTPDKNAWGVPFGLSDEVGSWKYLNYPTAASAGFSNLSCDGPPTVDGDLFTPNSTALQNV